MVLQQTLPGPGFAEKYIPTNKFSSNGCAGTVLVKDIETSIPGFTATRATSADVGGKNTSLPFCVTSLVGVDLPSQDYKSNRNWILTLGSS